MITGSHPIYTGTQRHTRHYRGASGGQRLDVGGVLFGSDQRDLTFQTMSDSFYLALPSHSSKNEFPDNTSNKFKIRLPQPVKLDMSGWTVGLFSMSLPDPKNTIPSWMKDNTMLM